LGLGLSLGFVGWFLWQVLIISYSFCFVSNRLPLDENAATNC